MNKMTTIQIRIDKATKIKAQKMFKKMGVSLSFAIKYYLTKVANAKNLKDFSDLDRIASETIRELRSRHSLKKVSQ